MRERETDRERQTERDCKQDVRLIFNITSSHALFHSPPQCNNICLMAMYDEIVSGHNVMMSQYH